MLLYEYQIRDRFVVLKRFAESLRAKFESGTDAKELLSEADDLSRRYEEFKKLLPESVSCKGSFKRHLAWMRKHLSQSDTESCIGDIRDICAHDLRLMEEAFRDWCASQEHYDDELKREISNLMLQREWDSAVRKGFVLLTKRLREIFDGPNDMDGSDLVNYIFGSSGRAKSRMTAKEMSAYRDLLAGMYSLFRNRYGHEDVDTSWHEADAAISIINTTLQMLDSKR